MRCLPLHSLNYWLLLSSALLCGFLWFYISVTIPGVLQFDANGLDKIFFSKPAFLGYIAFILAHCFFTRYVKSLLRRHNIANRRNRLRKIKLWPDVIEVVIRLLETIAGKVVPGLYWSNYRYHSGHSQSWFSDVFSCLDIHHCSTTRTISSHTICVTGLHSYLSGRRDYFSPHVCMGSNF